MGVHEPAVWERCPAVELVVEVAGCGRGRKFYRNCEKCPISRDFAEGWFVCCLPRIGLASIGFEPRDLMVRAR